MAPLVLLANTAATGMMVGIIWFIQVAHYPLFRRVGASGFTAYEAAHQRLTTIVVGPCMLIEALSGVLLLRIRPVEVPGRLAWAGMALLAVIWLSTALWQVPLHRQLSRGYEETAARALVRSNWLRTAAWTARGAIVLAMVWRVIVT